MTDTVTILRTALCSLLNLLHMKSENRASSEDWENWKLLTNSHKILNEFGQVECKQLSNSIAIAIKNKIVAMDNADSP